MTLINPTLLTVLFTIYLILIISALIITFRKEKNSMAIALWTIVIFLIPVFGAIINLYYYLFSHSKSNNKT